MVKSKWYGLEKVVFSRVSGMMQSKGPGAE